MPYKYGKCTRRHNRLNSETFFPLRETMAAEENRFAVQERSLRNKTWQDFCEIWFLFLIKQLVHSRVLDMSPAWLSWWCSGNYARLVRGNVGSNPAQGKFSFKTFIQEKKNKNKERKKPLTCIAFNVRQNSTFEFCLYFWHSMLKF